MTKDQIYINDNKVSPSRVGVSAGSKFLGATFLYLALALAITFGVVAIMGGLLSYALNYGSEQSAEIMVTLLFVGLILYIPTLIWVQIAAIRQGKTVGPAFFTYSIVMGLLISPLCLAVDFWTLVIAIGTTCLAFASMALIAWTSKKNMSAVGVIGSGILIGALFLSLFNLIFYFVAPALFVVSYMLIEVAFFVAIILITVFDLNNVKRLAMNGETAKNVALLCALNLYVDFIYIFIRLLRLIAAVRNK